MLCESDPDTATNNPAYLWTAAVNNDGTAKLTNKTGKTLCWNEWAYRASSTPTANTNFRYNNGKLSIFVDFGNWSDTFYPIEDANTYSNLTQSNFCFYNTADENQAVLFTLQTIAAPPPTQPEPEPEPDGEPFRDFYITNTPVGDAVVSLKVNKVWDLGNLGSASDYEESGVQMTLLANGEDSGLSCTLSLRNGWSYTFTDLPMFDSSGNEIAYTVREEDLDPAWRAEYGPITGMQPAYETTVTNVHRETVQLPSTGSFGRQGYVMLGLSIMLGGLGWYCRKKREEERGEC